MSERSIVAPDAATAIRWFVSAQGNSLSDFYLVSIDHSPSEQICGSEWHHSAIIVSPTIEHQALADDIGRRVSPSNSLLKQWKSTDDVYRRNFHHLFFQLLKNYPILVLGVSVREASVLSCEEYFASELGVLGRYRRFYNGHKEKVEFGPFVESGNGEPETLVISAKQAPMAIFSAAYLLRVHSLLSQGVCGRGETSSWCGLRMQVMSDKPPNDFGGKYAKLMWLLLGSSPAQGMLTWGGFTGAEDQQIDLLADNVAGLLNEITLSPEKYIYSGDALLPPVYGVFHWERLE